MVNVYEKCYAEATIAKCNHFMFVDFDSREISI